MTNQDRAGTEPDAIYRFDHQGNYLDKLVEFDQDLVYPYQMAECANGNVLVSTWADGVHEYTAEGQLVRKFPGIQGYGCFELGNGNILATHTHYPEDGGWVGEYDRLAGELVDIEIEGVYPIYIQRIRGPALVAVESLVDHGPAGALGVDVDLTADVAIEPGLVTTESRDGGIRQLRFAFEFALTDDAAGLNELALSITSIPGGAPVSGFVTELDESAQFLTVTFDEPLPDQYLYTIEVTREVTTHPGDRTFQIRALRGNVANDLGAPLQTVNAIDLGISQGVRGQFLPAGELVDSSNARYDVNLDGTINASDYSYIRLTGGVFGHAAP